MSEVLNKLYGRIGRILPKEKFARNVSILAGGTAGAQIMTVLASPLLTRLYSPADFGMLAIYISLLSLFSVIASFRYELAIPLPLKQRDAALVVVLCLGLIGFFTLFTALLVFSCGRWISQLLGEPRLTGYLWLLPISVLLAGTYSVFNYWATREKRFSEVAKTRIGQALASTVIQLIGFKWGGASLIFSQSAGQSVGVFTLGRIFFSKWNSWKISSRDIKSIATRYKRFPIYSTWEGFFNTVGAQLPPLLFGAFFSPVAAGLYSLANRVLSLPMSLIGSAIGQVFFANAAQANREGRLGILVAQFHTKLAHIGMAPAIFLVLLGPDLFALVFGEKWRQAGEFARWMSPWLYLVFVSSPLSTLVAVIEQQKQGLIFQSLLLLARILAISLGVILGDTTTAVMLFSGASSMSYIGFLFWIGRATNIRASTMIKPSVHALLIALVCAMPLLFSIFLFHEQPYAWIYGLIFSIVIFGMRLVHLLRAAY